MRLEAIYDNGRIEFTEPVHLKHQRVLVQVEVPDDELVADGGSIRQQPPAETGSLQDKLNRLLGNAAIERPAASPEADRDAFARIMEERDHYRNE